MIGYQDKINQILRGAETIKNMNETDKNGRLVKKWDVKDVEELKSLVEELEEAELEKDKLLKALKHLVIVAQKDEINKDHLDQALRKARNVIADIDPTVEKCDCCY